MEAEMQTKMRFLHAYSPERSFILAEDGAVDILLNEEVLAQDIAFGEATEYMEVNPGHGVIDIYPSGKREQVLVRNEVIIPEGSRYTLVLADKEGAPTLAPVQEGGLTLETGCAGIRFGHLVLGVEPVSISIVDRYDQSDMVLDKIEYGQISEYVVEPSSPVAFDLYTSASEERIARIPWTQYPEGKSITHYILCGDQNGVMKVRIVTLEE